MYFSRNMEKPRLSDGALYRSLSQKAVFTFYDILSVDPGTRMRVRDILRKTVFDIRDRSTSESAQLGLTLFGNVIRLDHLSLLKSSLPYLIPVNQKTFKVLLKILKRKVLHGALP